MDQEKKYELTEEMRASPTGEVLHRIRALRTFGGVVAGTLGGWIQSEKNLSQEGTAWVCQNAQVTGDAIVSGNALVCGDAYVADAAEITGDANVSGLTMVFGYAKISEKAMVLGEARVFGRAQILEGAHIFGEAVVSANAVVGGITKVCGNARLTENAMVKTNLDYVTVRGFGREQRATTFFRRQDGSVGVQCGCFYGSLQEFREQVRETHGDSKMAKEYLAIADLMELHFTKEGGDDYGADKEV